MSRISIVLAALAALLLTSGRAAAAPVADGPAGLDAASHSAFTKPVLPGLPIYVVELRQPPLATYAGGLSGFRATSPAATHATKLDASAPASVAYARFLDGQQSVLAAQLETTLARPVDIVFRYHNVLNGVALRMTPEEAASVRALPSVLTVTKSQPLQLETDSGPRWIGAPGIWDGSAVPGGKGTMGEGVIVGVIDTGINMDHPSFAAVGGDGYEHVNPFGEGHYKGFCDPENEHNIANPGRWNCNSKLIGAWSWPYSGDDPEDDVGHGSHTASTSAGDFVEAHVVAPTVAITLPLQGVAPHANIIAYDISTPGGSSIDSVMAEAIDQAVEDGCDVLNLSFGPDSTELDPWDPHHLYAKAFLNARRAGVLAAIAAGNSGPDEGTTSSPAPWMPAVAALTHNRTIETTLADFTGGDGPLDDIVGRGITDGYGPAVIVSARGVMKSDGTLDDGQCLDPFPPDTFHGEIVICDRGQIARVEKGQNVLAGGAGGFVLANTENEGASLVADTHFLPAVHITYDDAQKLYAWLDTGTDHMATILGMHFNYDNGNGDVMAAFSSRGPTLAATCCLRPQSFSDWESGGFLGIRLQNTLKPDFGAPGVDIWAAVATDPADPGPPEFDAYSGTSMATPHVAGAMALMRAVHPDWSPAEVHSALMTTAVSDASVRKEDHVTPATPLDVGAGRINVSFAANAGLLLDETADDMLAANPSLGGDPSALNIASMANFSCVHACSWVRTLTSPLDRAVAWTATTSGDAGMAVTVEPTSFTLEPGQSVSVKVSADVSQAPAGDYLFGRVDFTPDAPEISHAHMPIAVLPSAVVLPPTVVSEVPETAVLTTSKAEGSGALSGWQTTTMDNLVVEAAGFVRSTMTETMLAGDPGGDPFALGPNTSFSLVDVPADSPRLVAETAHSDSGDVDLFVGFDANGDGQPGLDEIACYSGGGSWTEMCDVRDPDEGTWWVLAWDLDGSGEHDVAYRFGAVDLDDDTMTVTGPTSATVDEPFDVDVGWHLDGLAPGDVLYGMLWLRNGATREDLASVGVDLLGVAPPPALYLPALADRDEAVVQP